MEKPKYMGGKRTIYIPRLRDQVLFRAMHENIAVASRSAGLSLLPRPPLQLLRDFRQVLQPGAVILRTDLRDFFASVPRIHAVTKANAIGIEPLTGRLLAKWAATMKVRTPWISGTEGDASVPGLPPGVSLSSSLAELWLSDLDVESQPHFRYFRYVDDIAIVCGSWEEARLALDWLEPRIRSLGLELSRPKTSIQRLDEGVHWLGLVHHCDRVVLEPGRAEAWLRRFVAIRRKAAAAIAVPGSDARAILTSFHKTIRDEISGRSSSRPAWYAQTTDDGSWKRLDRSLHALIRSLHRQAGVAPPEGRRLPSIHRSIRARMPDARHSAPSQADQGQRAPLPLTGKTNANKGQKACDGAEPST